MRRKGLLAAFLLSVVLCLIPALGYGEDYMGEFLKGYPPYSEKFLSEKYIPRKFPERKDRENSANSICVISLDWGDLSKVVKKSLEEEKKRRDSIIDMIIDPEKFKEFEKSVYKEGETGGYYAFSISLFSYAEMLEIVLKIKYADGYKIVTIIRNHDNDGFLILEK